MNNDAGFKRRFSLGGHFDLFLWPRGSGYENRLFFKMAEDLVQVDDQEIQRCFDTAVRIARNAGEVITSLKVLGKYGRTSSKVCWELENLAPTTSTSFFCRLICRVLVTCSLSFRMRPKDMSEIQAI